MALRAVTVVNGMAAGGLVGCVPAFVIGRVYTAAHDYPNAHKCAEGDIEERPAPFES
jgi:hypothetical protein